MAVVMPDPGVEELPPVGTNAAPQLHIPGAIMLEIIAHLRSALPNEGCGLVLGHQTADWVMLASTFYPGTNSDRSPVRYTMDAAQVISAFRTMRQTGEELCAIVHSHPGSAPTPSPTDFREAYYPDALMLIVSFAGEPPVMKAWRIAVNGGNQSAQECPIVYV